MRYFHFQTKRNSGMTLVETVVATAILITAITGPLALASQSIRASRDVRNQLIATNLASEGMEIIHSMISNHAAGDASASGANWLAGGGGEVDIIAQCNGANGCIADVTRQSNPKVWHNQSLDPCGSDTQCADRSRLYYNPTLGIYRQKQNSPTANGYTIRSQFRRTITLATPTAYQANITVTVYYQKFNNTEGKVVLTEEMYNWFPEL